MKKALLAIIILILFSSYAAADFYTGNKLLADLEKDIKDDPVSVGWACGYVLGVFDAYNVIIFNSPGNSTARQIIDIAIKYLKDHPENRHRSACFLLTTAFSETFPKKKN